MDVFKAGAALALLMLIGCAGQVGESLAAQTAVQYGVLKYIDEDTAKADRVYATATKIARTIEDVDTTVEALKQTALAAIDFSKLDLADQLVVRNMIDAIAAEIASRQSKGRLSGDVVVAVRTVVAWAREAALIAGATPCSVVLGNC